MNVKEYLITNNLPLLDNPKNIFILEWLEANAFCTPLEISINTKIPLKEINDILQTLYKNALVSFNEEKYKITFNGIKILNKLGLSDIQIKKLLSKTVFKTDELALYQSLFETWRADFLDIYLIFFYMLHKECDDIFHSYSNITSYLSEISVKETYTIVLATLLHDFGNILYTDETSKLMKYYTALYDYSLQNYCLSSEIYHYTSKYWKANTKKSDFSKYISNYFKNKLSRSYINDLESKHQFDNFKLYNFYNKNTINKDFELSYKILTNNTLLNSILTSQNISELSSSLHLTKAQTKFILKSIRSKIDALLPNETVTYIPSFIN